MIRIKEKSLINKLFLALNEAGLLERSVERDVKGEGKRVFNEVKNSISLADYQKRQETYVKDNLGIRYEKGKTILYNEKLYEFLT